MSNVVEIETSRILNSAELLRKIARRADSGELDSVIIVARWKEDEEVSEYRVFVSEDQTNKDVFWHLSAAARIVMDG